MAAITTFSTLKTAVADWLDRSDLEAVGGPIDQWVALVEDKLYRRLRLRFQEKALSVAISSGVAAIPSDFLELKHAYLNRSPTQPLKPQSAAWIYMNFPQRSSDDVPRYIGQDAGNFIFGPFPSDSDTLQGTYYAKLTALGTGNESNFLVTDCSDVMLYGCLLESIPYLGMDERAQYWQQGYDSGIRRLELAQKRERFPRETPLRAVPG